MLCHSRDVVEECRQRFERIVTEMRKFCDELFLEPLIDDLHGDVPGLVRQKVSVVGRLDM